LFPDETQKQILPKNVGMTFVHTDNPFAALGVLWCFPGWFDSLKENIQNCVLKLARSFQMLVHIPELFNGAEISKRLDGIFRPPLIFVH